MSVYTSIVYPAVLGAAALLLLGGAAAFAASRAGAALRGATWIARTATVVQVLAIVVIVVAGWTRPSLFTLVGYLVSAIALVWLLGISRIAAAPEPGAPRDPDRPVLSARQSVQVDAVVAMIVAAAIAVVAWRLHAILLEGVAA